MNTRISIVISVLALLLVLLVPYAALPHGKGAPAGNTGGPGGVGSCGNDGCHDSFAANTGDGAITITTPASFAPGETIDITIRVEQTGAKRFGFQATVRRTDNSRPVGALQLTDGTKFSDAIGDYITHDGAIETNDAASWTFQWRAPDEDTGDIVIYVAGLAANGNGNRFGDYVYTTQTTMPISVGVEDEARPDRFVLEQAYPNPFDQRTTITYSLSHPEPVSFALYDALGRIVKSSEEGYLPAGPHEILVDAGDLPAGAYFYEVKTPTSRRIRSIVRVR